MSKKYIFLVEKIVTVKVCVEADKLEEAALRMESLDFDEEYTEDETYTDDFTFLGVAEDGKPYKTASEVEFERLCKECEEENEEFEDHGPAWFETSKVMVADEFVGMINKGDDDES